MVNYGCEKLGKLRKVLLHKPVNSLKLLNSDNYQYYLFDKVPNTDKFLEEHDSYANLLKSLGIEVLELADYVVKNKDLIEKLPNLVYMHDSSVITCDGAIISRMCPGGRHLEDIVVKEALKNLEIPVFYEFDNNDRFEGLLLLSSETILVANTERHCIKSIEKFISKALNKFKEVIYVEIPKMRRFMHPDMIFNRISPDLALVYPPAFLHTYLITKDKREEIDFSSFMNKRGTELIEISDEEQMLWGSSFVPLEPDVIINYDISLNAKTKRKLFKRGVKIIGFHPNDLLAGGGSLRCLTLRLLRE
ncbi:MAG: arginine deiminase [Candidatus Melainabacteria bacterium RIFOXYA12_FULL_32_12]|nr:MAG: arginine deiminase [Candidatus Melainabacteria bacterium RIFOXYA2_FULL_32_9]OGI28604.1 MAG: arginine deiminase [Candidatus Melainabacteria bacterium RIFOXYA12_FULL_32_12]